MTGVQSSGAAGRPAKIPTTEELPPLLPRTPLAIIDESVTFLRTRPGTLLGVAFIVLLPLRLIAALLPGATLRDARPDQLVDILVTSIASFDSFLGAIGLLVADSVAVFAVGAIYGKLMARWFSGEGPSASDVLVWSIKRSPAIFVIWLIIHVIEIVGGAFSGGFGGVIGGVFLMVCAPIFGAEDAGVRTSLSRSLNLTAPRFFACFGVFVLVAIAGQVMRFVLRALPTILGVSVLPIPVWIVSGVFDLLATTVAIAFTASSAVVLYLDLRVRKEGIDLEVAMARVFPNKDTHRG